MDASGQSIIKGGGEREERERGGKEENWKEWKGRSRGPTSNGQEWEMKRNGNG